MKANLFFTSKDQIGSAKKPLKMSKRDKEVIQEAGVGANITKSGVYVDIERKKFVLIDTKTNNKWANEYFKTKGEAEDFAVQNNLNVIEKPSKLAKGGATAHGLKKGDQIKDDMFWEDSVVVTGKNGTAKVNLDKGTRTELKKTGGNLKANDIELGAWLKHKRTGAIVKVWNVDPKLGKMQLEDRYGNRSNKWYSAGDWEKTTTPKKEVADFGYGQGGTTKGFCYEIGGL